MKKIFLISLLFISNFIFAAEPLVNANTAQQELSKLENLETYINCNIGVTLEELQSTNNEIIADIQISSSASISTASGDLPANIPAIAWGICCTCVGVAIVYFATDKDTDETKKALLGCVLGSLLWGGGWFLLYGFSY